MSKPESKSENDATGTRLPSFILPTRPTGLPSDSHLRGLDNYAVWILQMETLVGNEGFKVMNGDWKKGGESCTEAEWIRLDSHARQCITLSCSQEVMKELTGVAKTADSWWTTLQKVFQPSDAQGHYRLLSRLFAATLPHASLEALKSFSHDYLQMVAQIRSEDIKIDEILSSHLLSVLPNS
ncbi:uncharacterized protein JCM6883_004473, partial [Sporobolomyces salmoneus]|uniref:uncharacterized protein n=1 Tax=Sporobolomyces salmoneus TaxID=183962 RepID=UPI00317C09A1